MEYDGNEIGVISCNALIDVYIVIRDASGAILYSDYVTDMGTSHTFMVSDYVVFFMYSIELIYENHHLTGYF